MPVAKKKTKAKRRRTRAPAAPDLSHIVEGLRPLAIPLAKLKTDPKNARAHSDRNLEALRYSLEQFGQHRPIVVQRKGLVVRAGNALLAVAKELGWSHVAALVIDESNRAAIARAIADNRTAELASWDGTVLASLLSEVAMEFPSEQLGFTEQEIKILDPSRPDLDDPEAKEPPAKPIAKLGELWKLGRHRLLCGDAQDPEAVARLFKAGGEPGLMVTDPPYGVGYDPNWREEAYKRGQAWGAPARTGKVANDDNARWEAAWKAFPGQVAYIWHGALHASEVAADLLSAEFEVRAQIIWKKPHAPMSRGHYHWAHEPCWYAVRKGQKAGWVGDRKQSTIWEAVAPGLPHQRKRGEDKEEGLTIHGTQKPLELMARPLQNHSQEIVYDPFLGSGKLLIAAEQLERTCVAVDIDPAYVDVAIDRWERLTGEKAKRVR